MSESEPRPLSPIETEERSTRLDVAAAKAALSDLEMRFENPGLSREQHLKLRTALQQLLGELKEIL